ncbi:MAG: hypothetical protein ACK5MU_02390 [Candidatus Saccharimonadales bacterium]
MNNERDFVDLDKAVKEHQMKKASSRTTAVKPATRGRFMDMVRPGAQAQPQARPSTRSYSAGRPSSATPSKVDAKNGPMTNKRRMDMVMPVKKAATLKPAETPTKQPTARPAPKETPKPQPKNADAPRPNLFSDDDFIIDDKIQGGASGESPNANNFSIGGRSPFIRDAKVDKRPLGPNVPESNAGAIRSTKNVYSQKTPLKAGAGDTPGRSVITVAAPKKKSGWLWAALTLGIIVAGGGIGLLAYMIFAQN